MTAWRGDTIVYADQLLQAVPVHLIYICLHYCHITATATAVTLHILQSHYIHVLLEELLTQRNNMGSNGNLDWWAYSTVEEVYILLRNIQQVSCAGSVWLCELYSVHEDRFYNDLMKWMKFHVTACYSFDITQQSSNSFYKKQFRTLKKKHNKHRAPKASKHVSRGNEGPWHTVTYKTSKNRGHL